MGRTAIPKGRETYESREVRRQNMSKRKRSEECGDRTVKRSVQDRKQHLYLLLDDWDRGYSVLKLDVDTFDTGANADLPPKRFTEPPVARIEAPHVRFWNFVSHGSKIFAMKAKEASPAIPSFDTHTLSLSICPWPSCRADYVIPLITSVGGKLFLFLQDGTEYLGDPPPHDSKVPWSWTTINSPLPFYNMHVVCYALHPDGRTLFVSAGSRQNNRPSTFSFDAERLEWTHHGDWLLPFAGQAYFDSELEAWVGLVGDNDSAGYLCSCDVPPVTAKLTSPPAWKLGIDKMFCKDSDLHQGAKLVYMGGSKFCLVESLFHKDDRPLHHDTSDFELCSNCPSLRRRVLRMTTFGLKYNKGGNLQVMQRQAQAQASMMFKRPHDFTEPSPEPLAFWI